MNLTLAGMASLGLVALFFMMGWSKGLIREILSLVGILVVGVTVYYMTPYVYTFLEENTQVYGWVEDNCRTLVEQTAQRLGTRAEDAVGESALVESLPLPRGMRQELIENNTGDIYSSLGVDSFLEYLTAFLSEKLFGLACVLVSWILGAILVGIISSFLRSIARLPGIREVNRVAGAILGALKGFLVVWLCLLVLTICCSTQWGRKGLAMVQEDSFLSRMYDETIVPLKVVSLSGERTSLIEMMGGGKRE